ncbi:serine/threonine protein kinase [Thalassobacillus devorans]|uniref:Serine/threonine protein kinase n=1 Tax=Thalassobacillus devorans TaxID=279813 RepID=A0ABQ1NSH1_9BACI|nr:ROK family transcriptional regulator [Thalassobacillus devorans]NIK28709.1 putative NBD/HSP70 family sugar kinase [Thalassobacillus devorans]GGC84148.1 serine/threonine protein kinase [Thalassobacillus devorans]
MKKTGGLKLMQEINQYIILKTIRERGPISRSEIAKQNKLSPTTVTSAVNELLEEGMVTVGGVGESSGGRKPVYLQFAPDSKFILGVSITNSSIIIGKLNMEADVKDKEVYADDFQSHPDVIGYTLDRIGDYLDSCEDLSLCLGVSIITPGIIDAKKGIIRNNAKMHLENIALKEMVEERFRLKAWIDNDANSIALAENKYGHYGAKRNLIYIQMGDGIGSGIVIEDQIFRGSHGGAGEFGHITIDNNGILCECGNRGCLENYVNWPSIQESIKGHLEKGTPTRMMDGHQKLEEVSQGDFLKALQDEDELALSVIEETIEYMANGLVTLVNLFNPEVILIGWGPITSDSYFINRLREKVKELAFDIFIDGLEIQATTLGGDFQLKGAASVALEEIFEVPL